MIANQETINEAVHDSEKISCREFIIETVSVTFEKIIGS